MQRYHTAVFFSSRFGTEDKTSKNSVAVAPSSNTRSKKQWPVEIMYCSPHILCTVFCFDLAYFFPFIARGGIHRNPTAMSPLIVFKLNQRRSSIVASRCLDRDYLVLKTLLLERFHRHLVFESVSPNTVRDFLVLF